MRRPRGLPEIDSPFMNRAAVNAEATIVSSLIVTVLGNVLWPRFAGVAQSRASPQSLRVVSGRRCGKLNLK